MSLDSDLLVDRRRLKRRAGLWRFLAVLAGIALLVVAVGEARGVKGLFSRPYVARVEVTGIITQDDERNRKLFELAKDPNVRALILHIDSPGGTTVGAESLFRAVRAVGQRKPVVAVMESIAASGGYIAALSADYIVAQGNTLTGSIGVLFQSPNFGGLMDKVGVQVEQVTSGPLKGEPNPFHPLDPRAREVLQGLVQDTYNWFVGLVSERRNIPLERARQIGDGRIYSGRQAVNLKLVDALGDERLAREWLAKKGVPERLPSRDVESDDGVAIGPKLGGKALSFLIQKTMQSEPLILDGMISVWQAPR